MYKSFHVPIESPTKKKIVWWWIAADMGLGVWHMMESVTAVIGIVMWEEDPASPLQDIFYRFTDLPVF